MSPVRAALVELIDLTDAEIREAQAHVGRLVQVREDLMRHVDLMDGVEQHPAPSLVTGNFVPAADLHEPLEAVREAAADIAAVTATPGERRYSEPKTAAGAANAGETRQSVQDQLSAVTPRSAAAIANELGISVNLARYHLTNLIESGVAEKVARGQFQLASATNGRASATSGAAEAAPEPARATGFGALPPIERTPIDHDRARANAAAGMFADSTAKGRG